MNDKSMLFPAIEYNHLKDLMRETIKNYSGNTAFVLKHGSGKNINYENITYDQFGRDIAAFATALIKEGMVESEFQLWGKTATHGLWLILQV